MKILLGILAAVSALATICIFILFVLVFIAWLQGGINFVFPGLGLVVTAPVILIALFIIGALTLSVTLLLARTIFRKSALR